MGILHRNRRCHGVKVLRGTVSRVAVSVRGVEHWCLAWRDWARVGCRCGHGNGMSKDALVSVATVGEEAARDHPGNFGRRKAA